MIIASLDAEIARRKKYSKNLKVTLTAKEIQEIRKTVIEIYQQQNGADIIVINGNSGIDRNEFVARRAGSQNNKGGQS